MQSNLKVLRYTRKRPLYADGRRPCMDSRKLGGEPLMYNRSMVKTFYDRESISKWFFKSFRMMDCKSMENSHDHISEEFKRLSSSRPISV
jgi:hypothetical protein